MKLADSLPEKILVVFSHRANYSAKLARETKGTQCGVAKSIIKLQKLGLIESYKKGRINYLKLTDKGLRVQELLKELRKFNKDD